MKCSKLLLKALNRHGKSTRPRHLFIITYGRSGSTLLMGILNSMKGVHIYGENYNTLFYLYQAIVSLEDTNDHYSTTMTDPFYRNERLKVDLIKKGLLSIAHQNLFPTDKNLKWVGFKEVRYSLTSF